MSLSSYKAGGGFSAPCRVKGAFMSSILSSMFDFISGFFDRLVDSPFFVLCIIVVSVTCGLLRVVSMLFREV